MIYDQNFSQFEDSMEIYISKKEDQEIISSQLDKEE